MFPGPVFHAELLTTARRARYYVLRALYGLLLLGVIWTSYQAVLYSPRYQAFGELSIRDMNDYARQLFVTFAVAQGIVVVLVTPALVAGTIAAEKERKTLHYLLASQLGSGEIVFGKVAARMLLVSVFLAIGLPVLSLLTLFGGVDLEMIAVAYAATIAMAFFLAGLSALVSTHARQARRAIVTTYVLFIALMLSEPALGILEVLFPRGLGWLIPVFGWINPLPTLSQAFGSVRFGYRPYSIWMLIAMQMTYGALMLVIAARRLRPVAIRQYGGKPRVEIRLDNRGRAQWRIIPRPPVGNDPMLWKERYTARSSGYARLLGLFFNLFCMTLIGCWAFDLARESIAIVWRGGFNAPTFVYDTRQDFNLFIRAATLYVFAYWMLGTTITAAGSIAGEREADTWISLIASPLEGWAIIRSKMIGAILRFRWLGYILLTLWTVGMISGALHPIGWFVTPILFAIFLGFASALGVRCSLRSNSTSRAMTLAVMLLVFFNGGYLLLLYPLGLSTLRPYLGGITPILVSVGLFSYQDMARLFETGSFLDTRDRLLDSIDLLPVLIVGTIGYALAALALTWSAVRAFDLVADRPRRRSGPGEEPASASWARRLAATE